MGSRGPEGWIQHLGLILLCIGTFTLRVRLPSFRLNTSTVAAAMKEGKGRKGEGGGRCNSVRSRVATCRKELGASISFGLDVGSWSFSPPRSFISFFFFLRIANGPQVRLSLAGGSILGLTAFLVGITIKDFSSGGECFDWNFAPPFAVGPGVSFPSVSMEEGGEEGGCITGPGQRMARHFPTKMFVLDVWNLTQWAHIEINGEEQSFATQIPGPTKGGGHRDTVIIPTGVVRR